jgi:hypothetical protein
LIPPRAGSPTPWSIRLDPVAGGLPDTLVHQA